MSRRLSFMNVLVLALCAIATIFTLVGRPSSTRLSSWDGRDGRDRRGHETVSPLKNGASDFTRLDRRAPIVERAQRESDGSAPPLVPLLTTASPLPSVAPLETSELRPFTWIAWCDSPTRARADLMVFLN